MEGRTEREILLSLIDDAERIVSGDFLGETIEPVVYSLEEKKEKISPVRGETASRSAAHPESSSDGLYSEIASCHSCTGYLSRSIAVPLVSRVNPRVLFIAPYPEGQMIFSPASQEKFRAWWKSALLLGESEWALTAAVKCPVGAFNKEAADACRKFLRAEMMEMKPSSMVIFGGSTASYMLGKNLPISAFRGRRFVINHIPSYVTYSPSDYVANPSLRKDIWNDMLFIRREIGTEGRKS